jgi:vitamin B12 transporter
MSLSLPTHPGGRAIAAFVTTFLPFAALAQETGPTLFLSPMTITATRVPTPESEVGSSVTIITGDEIQSRQQRTLPEILQDVPGLVVVQTGGPGGTASVFMRGTNPDHTKVFIDGIDVGDPSALDGTFDFAHLLAGDIDRIEVLRGPQSGLYGSDAIGGVINIITKSGKGPPTLSASVEGGSFGTVNQTGGVSGSTDRFNYAADIAHYHVGGVQVTPGDLVPPGRTLNDDSYDNKTFSTKLGATIAENADVGFVFRYIDSAFDYTGDDFVGPETARSLGTTQQLFTRGTAHLVLLDGALDQTLGISYTHHRARNDDPNPATLAGGNDPGTNSGGRVKFDGQGTLQLTKNQALVLGAEHEDDTDDNTTPTHASVANSAGFVQLQSSFGDRLFNTLSLRYDGNSQFGGKLTYRAAPALLIPETGTRFKGSIGTGYKAPALSQLYDNFPGFNFFGNPGLRPETSLGWDVGFEQRLLDGRVRFGSTYFQNQIHDLITYNDAFTTFVNIGRATTWGAESFVAYNPIASLTLRADHTYTVAQDDIQHKELERRPRNKASLSAEWKATEAIVLSASLLYVGPRIDVSRSGAVPGLSNNGYTLVNLAGSYDIGHGVTAFGRINNLLDRHYQDPVGFLHPSFGVFAGVRVALDAASLAR